MTTHRGTGLIALLFISSAVSAATYFSDPAAGEGGDGGAQSPWGALDQVVKSGHLRKLKPGDTLLLKSGFHGDVTISGDNDDFITITAAPGQSPQLSQLHMMGKKWIVKGLAISPSFGKTPYGGGIVSVGGRDDGSELVLEDCFIFTTLDASKWTKEEWMKANSGVTVGAGGSKHTLRNNYILNTRFAINMCAFDSLCEANVVTNFSGDGIRITRDGITAQYNVVKNAYVSDADGDANHDDLMQCFLHNKGTGTVRRVTVRGNILIGREDDNQPFQNCAQGIGFFDGPLVDFLVEKNVILTQHWHGVALFDAQNCKILDNACFTRWEGKLKPWVMIGGKHNSAKGNVVKNNMAHTFNFKADPDCVAENNEPVTEEAFNKRMKEQEAFINDKFGRFHPVAKYARVGLEKGENAASAAPAAGAAASKEKPAGNANGFAEAGAPVATKVAVAASAIVLSDEKLAAWQKRLIDCVAAATSSGKQPAVYMKLFGKTAENIKLAGASAEKLNVVVQGNVMNWEWAKVDRSDRYNIASAVADKSKPADLALLCVWALAADKREAAEDYLAKAKLLPGAGEDPVVVEAASATAQ
jgi:hypothetical protein